MENVSDMDNKPVRPLPDLTTTNCQYTITKSELSTESTTTCESSLQSLLSQCETSTSEQQPLQCESCESWPAFVLCEDCNVNLCEKCSHGHRKLPACRDHRFTYISDRIDENRQRNRLRFETALNHHQDTMKSCKQTIKTLEEYSCLIDTQDGVIRAEIDQSESALHKLITEVHLRLREELQRITDAEIIKISAALKQLRTLATNLEEDGIASNFRFTEGDTDNAIRMQFTSKKSKEEVAIQFKFDQDDLSMNNWLLKSSISPSGNTEETVPTSSGRQDGTDEPQPPLAPEPNGTGANNMSANNMGADSNTGQSESTIKLKRA